MVVFAGKETSAGSMIEKGIGVAARNKNTFLRLAIFVIPLNGDAMGGVFAAEAREAREADRSDLFEADEANSGDRGAGVKFGAEFGRELALNDFGVDPKIDQHSATNQPLYSRKSHVVNAASQSFQTGS